MPEVSVTYTYIYVGSRILAQQKSIIWNKGTNAMMHGYPFIGFGMGLLWLIAALVVAYLIYKLIKSEKILVPSRPVIRSAEDILAEWYAKGELTREQYMQMKEDLKN
jgi:putative membrane protein